jgi:hypothetical protein
VRERYLERTGLDRPTAVTSIGLVQVAGALVHVTALTAIAAWLGDFTLAPFRAPPRVEILVAVTLGIALVGAVLTPPGRRRLLSPIRKRSDRCKPSRDDRLGRWRW